MKFFAEHYGKTYAPNSRETVRRQTVHQFVDAGLAVINPDKPARPTNSGDTVYQIEPRALELVRAYKSKQWREKLDGFMVTAGALSRRYAHEREMQRIPLKLPSARREDRPGVLRALHTRRHPALHRRHRRQPRTG